MAESHVVSGLVSKYSELAGKVAQLQQQIKQLKTDRDTVGATIKMFDPDYNLKSIKGKRIVAKNTLFTDSEGSRLVLEAMRELEGTPTTVQIVAAIQRRKGTNFEGDELKRFRQCVDQTLQRFRKREIIEPINKIGVSYQWQLANTDVSSS